MSEHPNGAAAIASEHNGASTENNTTGRIKVASGTRRASAAPRRRGAEHYDSILWRVHPQKASLDGGFTLGITSAGKQAGVSTVAANLAIRAADHRQTPVLLVDANFVRPRQAREFHLGDTLGLTDVLSQECEPTDAIHASNIEGLSILPLGSPGLVERTVGDYETIASLMTELRGSFATVVFDLPPAQELRQSLLIAQQLDKTLLVVRCESTNGKDAQTAINRLNADGVAVAGAVVTQRKHYTPRWLRR